MEWLQPSSGRSNSEPRRIPVWIGLSALATLFIAGVSGCARSAEGSLEEYQPQYFSGAILWAPAVPGAVSVCTDEGGGFCYETDSRYFLQVVSHVPSDTDEIHQGCPGYEDLFVWLLAVPVGALDDGLVTVEDYVVAGYDLSLSGHIVPVDGAMLAVGRVKALSGTEKFGTYLVDAEGREYPGQVEPSLGTLLWDDALLQIRLLDLTRLPCRAGTMLLAPGTKITGWIDVPPDQHPEPAEAPTEAPPPDPTPTEGTGTAWLSGVVYPYATDCSEDGSCPSCGAVDVYAVDSATGAFVHTFVDGMPCGYGLEVPAPARYTVAALTRQGQVCGTYIAPDRLQALAFNRISEPSEVDAQAGDAFEDLHIPLYLLPDQWPRGLTCGFIPVDAPPDLVTITVENPNCVPHDLMVADRVITVPPYQTVAFDLAAGAYGTAQCYAGTTYCFEKQSYLWESDDQISLQWIGRDCWETDGSPFRLWVESVDGCAVSVNGVTYNPSTQGPWFWDWGDGSAQTGWFPQTHSYASPGDYTVEVAGNVGGVRAWTRIIAHVGRCP